MSVFAILFIIFIILFIEWLFIIISLLENTLPGAGGEIQLTDALRTLCKNETILAYDFEGKRYDIGDKLGFLEATVELALKRRDIGSDFFSYLKQKIKQIEAN